MNRPSNIPAAHPTTPSQGLAWYTLPAEQALKHLGVDEQAGLDIAEVRPGLSVRGSTGCQRQPGGQRGGDFCCNFITS